MSHRVVLVGCHRAPLALAAVVRSRLPTSAKRDDVVVLFMNVYPTCTVVRHVFRIHYCRKIKTLNRLGSVRSSSTNQREMDVTMRRVSPPRAPPLSRSLLACSNF